MERAFEAARSNNLQEYEYVEYKKSREYLRDVKDALAYAEEKARKKVREKAFAEGYAIGRAEARISIARRMLLQGASVQIISKYTGLSAEEISNL